MALETKERMALQKQIADLDRQMNDEVASHGRSPHMDVSSVTFPVSYWVGTAVLIGWALFADGFGGAIGQVYKMSMPWVLYLGLLLALFTVIATIKWFLRKIKGAKAYDRSESAKIIALRRQRDELHRKLEELNKQDKQYQNKV